MCVCMEELGLYIFFCWEEGWRGGAQIPRKIQSERVEGVDLPEEEEEEEEEEEGGWEVEGDVWKRKSKSLFTGVWGSLSEPLSDRL